MKQALIFARLTVKEAARRKLLRVLLGLTLLVMVLSALGLSRLVDTGLATASDFEVRSVTAFILIMIMFAYSFVLALTAVFVTIPSVATEVENGVALAVLTRPASRAQYLLGKWMGLVFLSSAYVTVASLAEFVVVRAVTGYSPPHPFMFVGYMIAETTAILTVALLVSTRLSPIAGGVVVLGAFMLAWIGGVGLFIGEQLQVDALITGGTVTRLMLPTDGMWKGAVFALEPAALVAAARAGGPQAMIESPFFSLEPPSAAYLAWSAGWLAAILGLAVRSFNRREI